MKKILSLFLSFLILFISGLPIMAVPVSEDENLAASLLQYKDVEKGTYTFRSKIPDNIKIKKQNGKFGVINSENNSVLIPFEYEKIKKLGKDTVKVKKDGKWGVLTNNNKLVMKNDFEKIYIMRINNKAPKDIIHSIYFGKKNGSLYAATPGRTSKDIFEKAFNKNNELSWIKFYNYPKEGIIVVQKSDKYGFLMTKGSESWLIMPEYEDFYIQDKGTTVFQQFQISYSNPDYIIVKKDGKWGILNTDGTISVDFQYEQIVMLEATIDEDIDKIGDNLVLTYKSITFPQENYLIAKKDGMTYIIDKKGKIYAQKKTVKNEITFNDTSSKDFLNEIYKENNAKAFVKFKNYPKYGIYVTKNKYGKQGLVISEPEKNYIIPQEYDEFKFQDSNTGIYKQLGISFSDGNSILAKKRGKWGLIDKNNNIIQDFKYNKAIILAARPKSKASFDKNGVTIEYESIDFPKSNLILVKENKKYGVIDRNGEVIIPLRHEFVKKEYIDQYALKDGDKIAMLYDDNSLTDNVLLANSDDSFGQKVLSNTGYVLGCIIAIPGFIILSPFLIWMFLSFGGGC